MEKHYFDVILGNIITDNDQIICQHVHSTLLYV